VRFGVCQQGGEDFKHTLLLSFVRLPLRTHRQRPPLFHREPSLAPAQRLRDAPNDPAMRWSHAGPAIG